MKVDLQHRLGPTTANAIDGIRQSIRENQVVWRQHFTGSRTLQDVRQKASKTPLLPINPDTEPSVGLPHAPRVGASRLELQPGHLVLSPDAPFVRLTPERDVLEQVQQPLALLARAQREPGDGLDRPDVVRRNL